MGNVRLNLYRDADETKSWMNEKDTALLSDDYGRDLASVQALQRKHEGLERDLAALEDKAQPLHHHYITRTVRSYNAVCFTPGNRPGGRVKESTE